MEYKLGVIGIGHWFRRLYAGVTSVGGIKIVKALGTRPYGQKADMLEGFGINEHMYYTVESDGSIPKKFFDGVDAVHISNPNQFHANQIHETLAAGKKVVVEKTFAVNKKEFDSVVDYIKKGGHDDAVYLHLHYIHKLPTMELAASLSGLVAKHGKIKKIEATFFEPANEEDSKRTWLFGMENGGIFMDWIHPFETVYYTAGASFGKIKKLELYETNTDYDKTNPTGVYTEVGVEGVHFAKGATMCVSMAKGTQAKYAKKGMLFTFESGGYVRLAYLGSEKESKASRGGFEVAKASDGEAVIEVSKPLSGESSSEIFVREIVELCEGINTGLTIEDIVEIFKPQWEYQSLAKHEKLITDSKEVKGFLERGVKGV